MTDKITAEMEVYSQHIADKAVKKVFAILGVDVEKPESVEEFREDLRFGKRLRRAADQGWIAFWVCVVLALAGATFLGVKEKLGIHN